MTSIFSTDSGFYEPSLASASVQRSKPGTSEISSLHHSNNVQIDSQDLGNAAKSADRTRSAATEPSILPSPSSFAARISSNPAPQPLAIGSQQVRFSTPPAAGPVRFANQGSWFRTHNTDPRLRSSRSLYPFDSESELSRLDALYHAAPQLRIRQPTESRRRHRDEAAERISSRPGCIHRGEATRQQSSDGSTWSSDSDEDDHVSQNSDGGINRRYNRIHSELQLKINELASYRNQVERPHPVSNTASVLDRQQRRPPSPAAERREDTVGSVKAAETSRSTVTGESNTTRSSEALDSTTAGTGKAFTVTINGGSGKTKLEFAGTEAGLLAGAGCSITIENTASYGAVPGDKLEEPLISLESPTGSASSVIDPFDYLERENTDDSDSWKNSSVNEEDSDNEKARREIIRRGKQVDSFNLDGMDHSEDRKQPASRFGSMKSVGNFGNPDTGGTADAISDKPVALSAVAPVIKAMEIADADCLRQKTTAFDSYSSEDLDIFDDCIGEGAGNFYRSVQILSSANSGGVHDSLPKTVGQRNEEGAGIPSFIIDECQTSGSSIIPETSRDVLIQDQIDHQEQAYECIIHGCNETFSRADTLARHTYEHGLSWKFSSSISRDKDTPKGQASSISSPPLQGELDFGAEAVCRNEDALYTSDALPTFSDDIQAYLETEDALTPTSASHAYVPKHDHDIAEDALHSGSAGEYTLDKSICSEQQQEPGNVQDNEGKQDSPWTAYYRSYRRQFSLGNSARRLFRPRVPVGSQRIEWICGCGEELYADFKNRDPNAVRVMGAILQAPISSPAAIPSPAQLQIPARSFGVSNHMRRASTSTSSFSGTGSQTSSGYGSQPMTDASSISSISSDVPSAKFLELCVNTGEHLKELGEIDLTNATCDGDLFGAVRERYLQIRGFRSRFWLLKPASVSYVRFSVEQRRRVGILQKPLAVPPKFEVDSKRWIYDPCPLDGDPPIAEHLFLHYLRCTQRSRNLFWMLRMPRKLKTRILNDGIASAAFGWGVHIEEGPDYKVICWVNFVGLLASGAFAAAWTVYKNDFQGAFGFACWLIAALNTLMFAFMYRCKVV